MEELYKKDLHDPDNHDDLITNLEPDILESEVKWALESITSHGWGWGCITSCKSPGDPVRQVREPSEGFELRHSFHMQETSWSSKFFFQRKVVGHSPL